MKPEIQRLFAELIGTFVLVFAGAGSVIANNATNNLIGTLGIAFSHGLALMAMIYCLGNISGAHFNPAVTIAFVFAKKMHPKTGINYILFQLVGSILAALALMAVFPLEPSATNLGTPTLNTLQNITFATGTLFETILTFFLVFTVFALALDKKNTTPIIGLAIGLTLAFSIIIGGNFTGAALNPARAFGPAIVSQHLEHQLVYWIGPIIGGLSAATIYQHLFLSHEKQEKKQAPKK